MKRFITNWNFVRVFRLLIGLAIIIQGIWMQDWMITILGTAFSLMPIFNLGCGCHNTPSCNTNNTHKSTPEKEIQFEEVQ